MDTILALAEKPQTKWGPARQQERPVLGHNFARAVTEAVMVSSPTTALIKKSDPAPDTEGGLYSLFPKAPPSPAATARSELF